MTSSELQSLYQEIILDHQKRPHGFGLEPGAAASSHQLNPTCGDEVTLELHLDDTGAVSAVRWDGHGCAISQASASLMTTQLKGKTAAEAEKTYNEFKEIVTTGKHDEEEFNELAAFAGVHAYPARIKCATLSWHAALDAIKQPPSA